MCEPTHHAVLAWLALVVVGVLALRGRVFAHALQLVAAHFPPRCGHDDDFLFLGGDFFRRITITIKNSANLPSLFFF